MELHDYRVIGPERFAQAEPYGVHTPPWRDAAGIIDMEDGSLSVPALLCWFTRPAEDNVPLARAICDFLNGKITQ